MKIFRTLFLLLCLPLASTLFAGDDDDGDRSKRNRQSELPTEVRKAVKKAVKGFKVTKIEIREKDGVQVYGVGGIAKGRDFYRMLVDRNGKVLKLERVKGDDGDTDDDDDGGKSRKGGDDDDDGGKRRKGGDDDDDGKGHDDDDDGEKKKKKRKGGDDDDGHGNDDDDDDGKKKGSGGDDDEDDDD